MNIINKNYWNIYDHKNCLVFIFVEFITYKKMERVRVKHASWRRVTSRSLIVGTAGLRSGAIALPNTDK